MTTFGAGTSCAPAMRQVGVVVPAKDEGMLLPACLDALIVAAGNVSLPVMIVVVLDDCTDGSAQIVESRRRDLAGVTGLELHHVAVRANNVGVARRRGVAEVMRRSSDEAGWLATTDADSMVPPHWLTAQLSHAADGASVVAGTVAVTDWSDWSSTIRVRAIAEYKATERRHVHAANLSFTTAAYRASGGFEPRPCDEDVALVAAFIAGGESIAWALDLAVETSSRRRGRAPFGFAGYLTGLEA